VAYTYKKFGDFASYVMQKNIMMETLTVEETLRFAADLKLNCSEDEKKEKIMELVHNMKLERCLDTLIGG
jgi:ABC-type multidrug transport system ATPase subunit